MSKIISTNIGEKVTIVHNGKEIQTGIYKFPVKDGIRLGKTDVEKDQVIDRRYHGGIDKACYLYPSENYKYWQSLFPTLKFDWGMFGENLTSEGLLETNVRVGSTYQIGETLVQVSQPRQPCYKLGIRFKNAKVVKAFSNSDYSGIYVRVLKEGAIKNNDTIKLINEATGALTLAQVFGLLMGRCSDIGLAIKAYNDPFLAESAKRDLVKIFGNKITN